MPTLPRLSTIGLALSLLCGACSHTQQSASSVASAAPTDASSPSPAPSVANSPTTAPSAGPAFTDLANVYGADKIAQLAQLGVFDTTTGPAFQPNAPIARRTFVRWAFNANNKLAKSDDKMIHPATPNDPPAFKDLQTSDADFAAIQGMQNANISVGFPDGTFKPGQPITREQAVSIAALLSCTYTASFTGSNVSSGWLYLPDWKDKMTISKTYVPVIAGCADSVRDIVGRTWGKILTFSPRRPVTRAEAALMLWEVDGRSAADITQASPAPHGT